MLAQQSQKPPCGKAGLFVGNKFASPLHRLLEAFGFERFQQVIQRMRLKCSQCVFVVSRGEDHHRQQRFGYVLQYFESIHLRHRFDAILTLADKFQVGFFIQEQANPLPGQRLIIGNKRSDFHGATLAEAVATCIGSVCKGSRISTRQPCGSAAPKENCWSWP